jgi:hypothetical protein
VQSAECRVQSGDQRVAGVIPAVGVTIEIITRVIRRLRSRH